jgi:hypothetical protein
MPFLVGVFSSSMKSWSNHQTDDSRNVKRAPAVSFEASANFLVGSSKVNPAT